MNLKSFYQLFQNVIHIHAIAMGGPGKLQPSGESSNLTGEDSSASFLPAGVWYSMPVSDVLASLIALVMLVIQFRKFKVAAGEGVY